MGLRRLRLVPWVGIGLALAACTTSADPSPTPEPPVGRVVLDQSAALMTEAGESVTLAAEVIGPDGTPTSAEVSWASSAPEEVSVSPDGVVTAHVDLGSAVITASAEGAVGHAVILIAQPVAGAVLVSDRQVVEDPRQTDPDELPGIGTRMEVVLAPDVEVPAGAIIIASGSKAIGGTVVSVEQVAGGHLVTYEVVGLDRLFARHRIEFSLPLDLGTIEPAPDTEITASADGAVSIAYRHPGMRPASLADGTAFTSGPLTCEAAAPRFQPTHFDLKVEGKPAFAFTDTDEVAGDVSSAHHTRVALVGPLSIRVFGGVKVQQGFQGKAECSLVWKLPIPLGGVLAALLRLEVPIGIGASGEGKLIAADVELGPTGTIGGDLEVGWECHAEVCRSLHDVKPANSLTFATKVNATRDMKVELGASIHAIFGLNAGVLTGSYSLVDVKVGPKQSAALSADDAQARDPSYASEYDLKLVLAVGLGDSLKKAIEKYRYSPKVDLSIELTPDQPLSRSPQGALGASRSQVPVGQEVDLVVDLDPATLGYFQLPENVASVIYARKEKDGSLRRLHAEEVSASGQTRFEWTWTPGREFAGRNEIVAFVTTRLLPGLALEVRTDSTTVVEVLEVCVGPSPSQAPPTAKPSGTPRAGGATPTPAPVDPCQADGQVATTIEWDVDEPAPSSGRWDVAGSVEFEVDPTASYDGYRWLGLTSASLTVSGVVRGTNPNTGNECVTTVPSQNVSYTNPIGPEHSSHPQGVGIIQLDLRGDEFLGLEPGNYHGQVSLLLPVTGTIVCDGASSEYDNEYQFVTALVIRSPITHEDAPTFVVAPDGRMSGSDRWEDTMSILGYPATIESSWNFVPVD